MFTNFVGVSNKPRPADTNCSVPFDLAVSLDSTRQSKAWVFTLFIYACKMRRTVRVNQTFWLRC